MKQRPRIYYTESQKALMRDRWQKGDFKGKQKLSRTTQMNANKENIAG